jgi:hypothetical protein
MKAEMMNAECGMRNGDMRGLAFIHHSSFIIPHLLPGARL